MIRVSRLEFDYLVSGWPQAETSVWGLVSAASWYTTEFWSTTPTVLRMVGATSTSVSARSIATGLAVKTPINSTITLHVQGSRSISMKVCSTLHFVWSYLGFHANPSQRSVVEHLPNNVSMTLCCTAHSDTGPYTSTFCSQVIREDLLPRPDDDLCTRQVCC